MQFGLEARLFVFYIFKSTLPSSDLLKTIQAIDVTEPKMTNQMSVSMKNGVDAIDLC